MYFLYLLTHTGVNGGPAQPGLERPEHSGDALQLLLGQHVRVAGHMHHVISRHVPRTALV